MRLILATLLATMATLAADPVTAGKYTGKWEGGSGAGGDFQMTLAKEGGNWKADVSFRMGADEVKCKVTSLSVEGGKLHVVYTFDLQGNNLESTIDGERSGNKLSGKYRTRAVGSDSAIDQGSWEASAT